MEEFKELFENLNVRMHRKQKKEFRNYALSKARKMGYSCSEENSFIAKNVVIGDVNKAKYVFTAHYDTPPRLPKFFVKHMTLYSIIFSALVVVLSNVIPLAAFWITKSIPVLETTSTIFRWLSYTTLGYGLLHVLGFAGNANKTNYNDNTSGCYALFKLMKKYQHLTQKEKDQIAFVFFDNEEKGLLGSIAYKFMHRRNYKDKTYINLDCIGRGKFMNLYHFGKKTKIAEELAQSFDKCDTFSHGTKKSGLYSLSDHFPFRKANHVCLLSVDENNKKSLYEQIHCSNDSIIEEKNIDDLVESIDNLSFMKRFKHQKFSSLKQLNMETEKNKKFYIKKSGQEKQEEASFSR